MPPAPQAGFFGKLPARGDFLRAGLPRSFVQPWDDWLQSAIAGSRALLGADWQDAWMEAPIWRFHLAAGLCGPDAVLGLWMPSVDRAGRHFPLTLALVDAPAGSTGWLDAAEAAGLAALADALTPDQLAAALLDALQAPGTDRVAEPGLAGLWWSDGAPRVPPTALRLNALPDAAGFAAMLQAAPDRPAPCHESTINQEAAAR